MSQSTSTKHDGCAVLFTVAELLVLHSDALHANKLFAVTILLAQLSLQHTGVLCPNG